MLVISLGLYREMTTQEEAVAHIGLRTEIAETIITTLHLGIFRNSTQIDTVFLHSTYQ